MAINENDKFIQEALDYHKNGKAGKIEIRPTKPTFSARDLSLAYSPGVAYPCLEIAKNPLDVSLYTSRSNLVGVISNGTAVLGLGNIGALASKPVMEGKGVLFKKFADIDVFDIEINENDTEKLIQTIKSLEPTFGGINLEDIKAPECFVIEKRLKAEMNIPVFHDDQHGTAIIASAGFLNALKITERKIEDVKVVFSGAGAAAIATARLFKDLGIKNENLIMTDSVGVVFKGRTEGMNIYKEEFAVETNARTLADAMKNADAFIGCSAKGILTGEMVKTMAKNPIIFAMANPDPEIAPEEVALIRSDAIMATGRSDYPNQVNNVLGFPFIFRGALDVGAKTINEAMKLAAVHALAELAQEEVPGDVKMAYGNQDFNFGKNYIIPKPFDKRVLTRVAPAVAKAAMDSGVATRPIEDWSTYIHQLENRMGPSSHFLKSIRSRLSSAQKPRIVFAEGTTGRILNAVNILDEEGLIEPILLGDAIEIHEKMKGLGLSHLISKIKTIHPTTDKMRWDFSFDYYEQRQRKGVTKIHARDLMKNRNFFGAMMLKHGHAEGFITGASQNYPECLKAVFNVLGSNSEQKVAGIIILVFRHKTIFLADCTVQIDPNAEELAQIALSTASLYRKLMLKVPRVAFLSFSNFGSNQNEESKKMRKAAQIAQSKDSRIVAEGEIQADVAVNFELMNKIFDFSKLDKSADILIFPNLSAANISYKLLSQLAEVTAIGPILMPMSQSANVVQRTATVQEIVNISHLSALVSQTTVK